MLASSALGTRQRLRTWRPPTPTRVTRPPSPPPHHKGASPAVPVGRLGRCGPHAGQLCPGYAAAVARRTWRPPTPTRVTRPPSPPPHHKGASPAVPAPGTPLGTPSPSPGAGDARWGGAWDNRIGVGSAVVEGRQLAKAGACWSKTSSDIGGQGGFSEFPGVPAALPTASQQPAGQGRAEEK